MSDRPKGPKFVLTWKTMLMALMAYLVVRIVLELLNRLFQSVYQRFVDGDHRRCNLGSASLFNCAQNQNRELG